MSLAIMLRKFCIHVSFVTMLIMALDVESNEVQ